MQDTDSSHSSGGAETSGRLTWTVEEAAALLGISRPTAYEAVKTGSIPHIKIGRRILIPVAALEKMLADATGRGVE